MESFPSAGNVTTSWIDDGSVTGAPLTNAIETDPAPPWGQHGEAVRKWERDVDHDAYHFLLLDIRSYDPDKARVTPIKYTGSTLEKTYTINARPSYDYRIRVGDTWRYLPPTNDPPPTGWDGFSFNDSGWSEGQTEIGYGDGDEKTDIGSELPSPKPITLYFRKRFSVPSGATVQEAKVRVLRDDGVIAYLQKENSQDDPVEWFRDNLTGDVGYQTLADDPIGGSGDGDEPMPELRWYTFVVEKNAGDNALTAGCNYVLAVEIHQVNQTSSDASFNLQLLLKYTE